VRRRRLKRKPNRAGANALDMAVAARDRDVVAMVQRAVAHREVMLAYQPVVTAGPGGGIAFYEGLIRVLDDTGRVIPARDFITQIESMETGRDIDCLALELGLQALTEVPDLRLSINMSARSIGYGRWMQTLRRGLARDETAGERLILEITETSALTVPELIGGFMRELQAEGIAFALDDFGAGYTAFRYFRDYSFDIVKIDGQFIRKVATDRANQVITTAMVHIARHFDMLVVAETVENQEDAAYLASIGVDCLQGYYFGAPTLTPPWTDGTRHRAQG